MLLALITDANDITLAHSLIYDGRMVPSTPLALLVISWISLRSLGHHMLGFGVKLSLLFRSYQKHSTKSGIG